MASKSTQVAPAPAKAAEQPGTEVAAFNRNTGLTSRMAAKFGIEPERFLETLKQTAFRQRGKKVDGQFQAPVPVSNEQMAMMLHIAEKYDLDPFAKQLYAFASDGGITPIVPVDGWIAIINRHPQFEGMEIETAPPGTASDDYWVACTIERKDRTKPTRIEEWLKECYRDTDPWNSHPKRMLRHKAIIQCARVAFGYTGIFDPDEEERIYANAIDVTPPKGKPETRAPQAKQVKQEPDPDPIERITLDQATSIADKLKEEGVTLSALLARFEVGALEELPAVNYEQALKVIDEISAAS